MSKQDELITRLLDSDGTDRAKARLLAAGYVDSYINWLAAETALEASEPFETLAATISLSVSNIMHCTSHCAREDRLAEAFTRVMHTVTKLMAAQAALLATG